MTESNSPAAPGTMLKLSIMMFLQFFVWGAWYVSMTGWMGVAGLNDAIGWAYTVGPIAAVISPFFLGIVADRFFATQKVLGAMHLLGGLALLAVPLACEGAAPSSGKSLLYVLLLLAHMLCYMPTLGLTNTLCFHNMSAPEKQFPMVRVFGTIGWIVGNIVVGGKLGSMTWIADGDKSPMQFFIAGGAALLLGLFSFGLPHTPPPAAGKQVTIGEIIGLDSLRLLSKGSYLVFVICSFLICIPLAGYYALARNFVEHVGFTNATFTMSYGQMSEILFMVAMPLFFRRLGVKWMLAVGMLAWVVRYGLFSAAADDKIMWMTLGGVILHGICYDFFFVTGFLYVDREAPKEIRGQAQGFLVLITQGLGLGVGAQLINMLREHYTTSVAGVEATSVVDWKSLWFAPAAFAAVVLVIFVIFFHDKTKSRSEGAA